MLKAAEMTKKELSDAVRLLLGAGLHYSPAPSSEVFAAWFSVYGHESAEDFLTAVKRWIKTQANFPTPVELRDYMPEKRKYNQNQIEHKKDDVIAIDPDKWDAMIKEKFGDKFLNKLRKREK